MGTRWIIHKKDGITINSNWDSNDVSFRKNWSKYITSIQLQREIDKKLFTLSSRNNSSNVFWQTDDFVVGSENKPKMLGRRIFKSLGKDNWIEFCLKNGENITINVINKKIKVE